MSDTPFAYQVDERLVAEARTAIGADVHARLAALSTLRIRCELHRRKPSQKTLAACVEAENKLRKLLRGGP